MSLAGARGRAPEAKHLRQARRAPNRAAKRSHRKKPAPAITQPALLSLESEASPPSAPGAYPKRLGRLSQEPPENRFALSGGGKAGTCNMR